MEIKGQKNKRKIAQEINQIEWLKIDKKLDVIKNKTTFEENVFSRFNGDIKK